MARRAYQGPVPVSRSLLAIGIGLLCLLAVVLLLPLQLIGGIGVALRRLKNRVLGRPGFRRGFPLGLAASLPSRRVPLALAGSGAIGFIIAGPNRVRRASSRGILGDQGEEAVALVAAAASSSPRAWGLAKSDVNPPLTVEGPSSRPRSPVGAFSDPEGSEVLADDFDARWNDFIGRGPA